MSYQAETFYESKFSNAVSFLSLLSRLPVVSDCPAGQTARVTSNLHSSSSTMAVSRVPSPPLPEVNTPVAENWCYTQVRTRHNPLNTQRHYSQHSLYKKGDKLSRSAGTASTQSLLRVDLLCTFWKGVCLIQGRTSHPKVLNRPTTTNRTNATWMTMMMGVGRCYARLAGSSALSHTSLRTLTSPPPEPTLRA